MTRLALVVLFVAACSKPVKLQVITPGGAVTYTSEKASDAGEKLALGTVFDAKIPKSGELPNRVRVGEQQQWVDKKDVLVIPAPATVRFTGSRFVEVKALDEKTTTLAFGAEVKLVQAAEPFAVLDGDGKVIGFLVGKTPALLEAAPTPAQRLLEAKRALAKVSEVNGVSAARELLKGTSDDAAKALLAALDKLDKLDDQPARKAAREAAIPGDKSEGGVGEGTLAYVRVPKAQLKLKEGTIELAFGDAVLVSKVQGELAKIVLDPGAPLLLTMTNATGLSKSAVTVAMGAGALEAFEQSNSALATLAAGRATKDDFDGAFYLAARRLYDATPLADEERLAIARYAAAAGKLDVVAAELGGAAAAAPAEEKKDENADVVPTEITGSPGAIALELVYGCKGKPLAADIVDKKGVEWENYDFKSMPKNLCLAMVDVRKPPAPEDPENEDHYEDSYPTKADQRRAKKEYERELASYNRTILPKWERFESKLGELFGGDAYLVVTVTPMNVGNERLFAYEDEISGSCDPRGGCMFKLTGTHTVQALPILRGEGSMTLWLPTPKSSYYSHEHGVIAAASEEIAERWLTERAEKHGNAMDMPDFKAPDGIDVTIWNLTGPLE